MTGGHGAIERGGSALVIKRERRGRGGGRMGMCEFDCSRGSVEMIGPLYV
jgi:hypothetical protein